MFKTNVGSDRPRPADRRRGWPCWSGSSSIRAPALWHYAKLIGIVPLLTGLFGTCPLYSILGVSTCPMKRT